MRRLMAVVVLLSFAVACYAQEGVWDRLRRQGERVVYTGTIVNRQSNQCLDIASGYRDARGIVQQYPCNGMSPQSWQITRTQSNDYVLRNVATNKVLQVQGASMNIGVRLEQADYNGSAVQRWRIEPGRGRGGEYRLVNVNSGLCVEAGAGPRGDRGAIVQNRCGMGAMQRWSIANLQIGDRDDDRRQDEGPRWPGRPTGGPPMGVPTPLTGRVIATGSLVNRASGRCLDVDGPEHSVAKIQQWRCTGYGNQRWNIVDLGNGEVALVMTASNKVADVDNYSRDNGATLHQYDWHGGGNQRWRIRKWGDLYQFVNVESGKCLDVQRESQGNNGGKVQQWNCSEGDNQQWGIR